MNECTVCRHVYPGRVCPVCRTPASPAPAPRRSPLPVPPAPPLHPAPPPLLPSPAPPVSPLSRPSPHAAIRRRGGRWEIEGRVTHVGAVATDQPRFTIWRPLGILLGVLFLLPWLLSCAMLWIATVATWFFFGGRAGGGGFGPSLSFRLIEVLFRPRDKVNVYGHLVQCGPDLVSVRQEGELREGRIFTGHEVTLWGQMEGNTLQLQGGLDRTTGARFAIRADPWRTIVLVEGALIAAQLLAFVALGLSASAR